MGAEFRIPNWGVGAHQGAVYLLLTALTVSIAACQSPSTETEQWMPPYLQLHLHAGKAQVQWSDASEWVLMEGEASIIIEKTGQIIADAVDGAQFYLGDGSTLELAPESVMEVRNPRTLPRLQVVLQNGRLLFVAQKPSYEFILPVCSVTILSIPSHIRVEVDGETTRLAVEEGAVACELETETLTLLTCQEMYIQPGEEPEVIKFCVADTPISPSTPTYSPSPTLGEFEPTATPSPSPTPTPTPREVVPTLTHAPVPPTDAPPPPPPPTEPPPPPPTDTPPPPPTNPPRPTPTPEG